MNRLHWTRLFFWSPSLPRILGDPMQWNKLRYKMPEKRWALVAVSQEVRNSYCLPLPSPTRPDVDNESASSLTWPSRRPLHDDVLQNDDSTSEVGNRRKETERTHKSAMSPPALKKTLTHTLTNTQSRGLGKMPSGDRRYI